MIDYDGFMIADSDRGISRHDAGEFEPYQGEIDQLRLFNISLISTGVEFLHDERL